MKIDSIKDLDKVLVLCRKRGVQSIKIDNVEFHLGDVPSPVAPRALRTATQAPIYAPGGITADTRIDMPDELSPEQLLMWSTGGNPEAL